MRVWIPVALALCALGSAARAVLEATSGLQVEYVAGLASDSAPVIAGRRSEMSTARIAADWQGSPPAEFRARWFGHLVVERSGWYTLATTSDDGSRLFIDGRLVVNNDGRHGAETRTGRQWLDRGPHFLLIEYFQAGGHYELSWSWAPEGSPLTAVPWWAVWTRRPSGVRVLLARIVHPIPSISLLIAGLLIAWLVCAAAARRIAASLDRRRAIYALRAGLVIVSLGCGLFLAEWLARLAVRHVHSAGDARTYVAARSLPVRANGLGYRDPEFAARGDRYRIIVVGDSITWGQGIAEEERFSNLLERALGACCEVLNLGIPGRNIPDHVRALDQALALTPDFVLLQLFTNDFEVAPMQRPQPRPLLPWTRSDRWLLRSSVVYDLMSSAWTQAQDAFGLVETYPEYMDRHLGDGGAPAARAAFGMVREFIGRTRAADVPTGIVMFPYPVLLGPNYPFGYLHDRVHAICVEEQLRCVDLRETFSSRFPDPRSMAVSRFDAHPNAAANAVAADGILAGFKPAWPH